MRKKLIIVGVLSLSAAIVGNLYIEKSNRIKAEKIKAIEEKEVILNNIDGVLSEEMEFNVDQQGNMQGITYGEKEFFIGYDMKNGNGKIRVYDEMGNLKRESKLLKIGHSAGLAFNANDGYVYVANGGGKNPTKIYKLDPKEQMEVVKEINFSRLGNAGLVAIKENTNELILHTAKFDKGKHIFSRCSMDGEVFEQFEVENLGIPQGLEVINKYIYFYTNNKITVIDMKEKKIVNEYRIDKKGESEGLTFIKEKGNPLKVAYGYNNKNRIYINKINIKSD